MPFLGSSKKHDNNTADADMMDNTTASGRHHAQPTNQTGLDDYPNDRMGDANAFSQMQSSGPGANNDNNSQTGVGQDGNQRTSGNPFSGGQDDPYTTGGVGSGRQGDDGGGGGRSMQAPGGNDQGTGQMRSSGQGAGGRPAGNLESVSGPMIGSDALKAKRLQKEQEINVIKLQGGELAEAERLENEALARRERAVAHGADPANSALGTGNTGLSGAGVR